MFDIFATAEAWISLLTLTALEIVLGIDNIVFITILTGRLPKAGRARARRLGLGFALLSRLGLLFAISWILGLTRPLFVAFSHEVSARHLILLGGGLFLIAKSTLEIFEKLELARPEGPPAASPGSLWRVLAQVMLLDVVFSLDSVITAVGMAQHLVVMALAMILAVALMLAFAGAVGEFIERHPSLQILALSFLLLIGVLLVAEGLGQPIEKAYLYFAMAFSLAVELVNMRVRNTRRAPLRLHSKLGPQRPAGPAG